MAVESMWCRLKKRVPVLKTTAKPSGINLCCDYFSTLLLVKPEKLYDFTLRAINRYYFETLAVYKHVMG